MKPEPQQDSAAPSAAAVPTDTGNDFNISTEVKSEFDNGAQQEYPGQPMQGLDMGMQNNGGYGAPQRHHSEDRDRPIQIKDDG